MQSVDLIDFLRRTLRIRWLMGSDRRGIWKIIDANTLRRPPLLEDFFRADALNVGVFTDFGCMECYKGSDPVANLSASLRIVSRYPKQIALLKSTGEIVALSAGRRVERDELLDRAQTKDFAQFCKSAQLAKAGDKSLIAQIREHSRVANEYLNRMLDEAAGIATGMLELAEELPADMVRRLRRNEKLSAQDLEAVVKGIVTLAGVFFEQHPDHVSPPASALLPSTFIFRYSLACYLLSIQWIAEGGVQNANPKVLANDTVDMNYVAIATYFDGVLSLDRKVLGVYDDASLLLQTVFRA